MFLVCFEEILQNSGCELQIDSYPQNLWITYVRKVYFNAFPGAFVKLVIFWSIFTLKRPLIFMRFYNQLENTRADRLILSAKILLSFFR